jgi:hypothetical protein
VVYNARKLHQDRKQVGHSSDRRAVSGVESHTIIINYIYIKKASTNFNTSLVQLIKIQGYQLVGNIQAPSASRMQNNCNGPALNNAFASQCTGQSDTHWAHLYLSLAPKSGVSVLECRGSTAGSTFGTRPQRFHSLRYRLLASEVKDRGHSSHCTLAECWQGQKRNSRVPSAVSKGLLGYYVQFCCCLCCAGRGVWLLG